MSHLSQTERDELLAKAAHLRGIAADQLDPLLCRAAQALAKECEQRAAELERPDRD